MNNLLPEPDALIFVEMACGERELLGEFVVLGSLRDAGLDERGQVARIIRGERDALLGRHSTADREVYNPRA